MLHSDIIDVDITCMFYSIIVIIILIIIIFAAQSKSTALQGTGCCLLLRLYLMFAI